MPKIYIDGSGDVNEVAIAHYNAVIDDVLEKGEQPASFVQILKPN